MTRVVTLMICAAALAGPLAADAVARPTKIALTRIDDDVSGLGKAVTDALVDSDLELIPARQVSRAIDRLGLDDKLADRDMAVLADELEVDALVCGAFDRHHHKVQLTIFARGKKGKPFSVEAKNPQSDKFRKLVRMTVIAKLAGVGPRPDRADSDAVAEAAEADAPPARPAKGSHKPKRQASDGASGDAGDDAPKAKARGKAGKATDDDIVAEAVAPAAKTKAAKSKASDDDGDRKKPAKVAADDDDGDRKKPAKSGDDDGDGDADRDRPAKPAKPAKATESPSSDGDRASDSDEPGAQRADKRVAARDDRSDDRSEAPTRDDEAVASTHLRLDDGPAGGHSANLVAVRADLGSSVTSRSLTFDASRVNPPIPYRNAPVAGARLSGELYPWAFVAPHSWLGGLGIAGDFDQTIALTVRASAESTVPLKATQRHYSIGLRYRIALGDTPTSPTVTLGGGYSARTFTIDRSGLMAATSLDVPDVDYRLYDPGVSFRMPFGRRIAATLEGRGFLLTSAGAIQLPQQYGTTTIIAGTAAAGVEIIVADRVALRLAAEATQFNLKFAGNGALSNSRDGDTSTIDVRKATDRYLGGAATLAIMY